jgi:hypothetical protein
VALEGHQGGSCCQVRLTGSSGAAQHHGGPKRAWPQSSHLDGSNLTIHGPTHCWLHGRPVMCLRQLRGRNDGARGRRRRRCHRSAGECLRSDSSGAAHWRTCFIMIAMHGSLKIQGLQAEKCLDILHDAAPVAVGRLALSLCC